MDPKQSEAHALVFAMHAKDNFWNLSLNQCYVECTISVFNVEKQYIYACTVSKNYAQIIISFSMCWVFEIQTAKWEYQIHVSISVFFFHHSIKPFCVWVLKNVHSVLFYIRFFFFFQFISVKSRKIAMRKVN